MEEDIFEEIISGKYDNKLPFSTKRQDEKVWNAYQNESGRLFDLFKKDLFRYCKVENNPKKDLLFSKAWELGHSSGFNEVANYFDDLVDLIK